MRVLSPQAADAAYDDSGNGDVFLACLTIEPTSIGSITRHLVNNNEDITGTSGTVYQYYPFDLLLPDDSKSTISSVSIKIENVDQLLVTTLRGESEPPKVTLRVIMASTKDDLNPEIIVEDLYLRNVSWDSSSITGTLSVDSLLNAKFPSNSETYDPLTFPGLF